MTAVSNPGTRGEKFWFQVRKRGKGNEGRLGESYQGCAAAVLS